MDANTDDQKQNSHILRWYALQALTARSKIVYVIEGDVQCKTRDWMTSCLPNINEGITTRSCLYGNHGEKDIESIIRMYENTNGI